MDVGLYIHVPFCLKKCQYCSFFSVPREDGLVSRYREALSREMEIRAASLPPGEITADSIYIGGGTPTCLSGDDLAGVLERASSLFNPAAGVEITVEANPGTLGGGKLEALKKAGANRLSIGVQACRPEHLDALGRIHSFPEAREAFREARRAGFDNINADLIFGIPGQDPGQWRECLERVAALAPEHISAYGLQLEEGTPLWRKVREGVLEVCPEDLEAEMYQDLIETLTSLGYVHYEVSSFALPGRLCRHNLRYWHNRPYLGFGPASHSYLGGRRMANDSLPGYLEQLEAGRLPAAWQEDAGPGAEMSETVFLGLRLLEGLDLEVFRERFGKSLDEAYPGKVERLIGLGLVEKDRGRLRLTRRGLFVGNAVFGEFV